MEEPKQVWRLLQKWLTPADAKLWRAASYRFHALVTAEWRRGRVLLAGDAAHQQPPFIGQGMCQGVRDVANLVWKLDRVLRGQSSAALLDSYGEERGAHVRELTTRIKAIGHVICERDPVAADARDARILAEGNGEPRTITRQDIVPPLQQRIAGHRPPCGERSVVSAAVGADGSGTAIARCRPAAPDGVSCSMAAWRSRPRHRRSGARVGYADYPYLCGSEGTAEGDVVEENGVVARWFDRHGCAAAIVRPDHYVYGVSRDLPSLSAMMSELSSRLQ